MEMRHVSDSLYDLLMSQGLTNTRPASLGVRGIGDGDRSSAKSAISHQPAVVGGDHQPMGMGLEKDADRQRPAPVHKQNSWQRHQPGEAGSFAFEVHMNPNAHTMQARKTARDSATFLTCIIGGKR